MTKITIVLEDNQGRQFEIEVDQEIIAEAPIIEYKREYYMYKPSVDRARILKPLFVKIPQPAFVG